MAIVPALFDQAILELKKLGRFIGFKKINKHALKSRLSFEKLRLEDWQIHKKIHNDLKVAHPQSGSSCTITDRIGSW